MFRHTWGTLLWCMLKAQLITQYTCKLSLPNELATSNLPTQNSMYTLLSLLLIKYNYLFCLCRLCQRRKSTTLGDIADAIGATQAGRQIADADVSIGCAGRESSDRSAMA